MSKSKGNVVNPIDIIEKYGSDSVRSYFCSKISIYNDGLFSEEKLSSFYNDFFVNNLGNLFSRVFAMLEKYFNSKIPFETSSFRELGRDNEGYFESFFCSENLKEKVDKLTSQLGQAQTSLKSLKSAKSNIVLYM